MANDFFLCLPKEVSDNILSYLTPEALATLSRCSKLCRRRGNSDKLWLNLCRVEGWMKYGMSVNLQKEKCHDLNSTSNVSRTSPTYVPPIPRDSTLEAICKWKDIFMRATHLKLNWQMGRYVVSILRGHTERVNSLDCNGRLIVSGGADEMMRVWDLATCSCLYKLHVQADEVTDVKIVKNLIVVASMDGCIRVVDALTGNLLLSFQGHGSSVDHMAFDGTHIASTSSDRSVRIWSIAAAELTHVLHGHTDEIECLCMCGELVLTGAWDKTLILWHARQGVLLHHLRGHREVVNTCQFDRHLVVSGSADCDVRMWSTLSGDCLKVLQGHTAEVYCVAYNREVIASGSADSTVIVWTLTGVLRFVLRQHLGVVRCLHLDDEKLVSGGDQKRIIVWDYRNGDLLNIAHRHPSRLHLMWVNETQLITASPERPGTLTLLNYW